jgi:hypothetical protein
MIKIQIDNVANKEQEYINATHDVVIDKIRILIRVLENLNGNVIDFTGMHLASLKSVTKSIIDLVEENINLNLNGKNNYQNEITNYVNSVNNLNQLNITALLILLNYLTVNGGINLNNLLCCKPEQLINMNSYLLNTYNVNTVLDTNVLKLAFSYQAYPEIADNIKTFFRDNNFVKYCPYCNSEETEFTKTLMGNVVHSHQLDHFFDKANHPLLSYSMYNLVPSDSNCNATNKGQLQFSDEYFLNPYIDGFGNSIMFLPDINGTDFEVSKISVQINEPRNSNKFRQLVGNNNGVNENDTHGNINVFKIQSKHNKTETIKRARKVLKDIHKNYSGLAAIKKYTDLLRPLNSKANYLKWYNDNICTSFKYSEFNNERYSKFNRDVHDYYFKLNQKTRSRYVRELIAENLS